VKTASQTVFSLIGCTYRWLKIQNFSTTAIGAKLSETMRISVIACC